MLGRAKRLRIDAGRCLLLGPAGRADAIAARRDQLRVEAQRQRHVEYDREHLLRRAARLGGQWAELRIAGHSAWDTGQKVEAARVAVGALRAAAQSGLVPGGGMALRALADGLEPAGLEQFDPATRQAAIAAVRAGCRAVTHQIAMNAGLEVSALHVPPTVVDPLAVTQTILNRALSVATTLLGIELLVC